MGLSRSPLLLAILESKKESPLRPGDEDDQFTMDHRGDRFIHFAPTDKAEKIAREKRLIAPEDEDGEKGSVYGISTTYGQYVPRTQTTHNAPRSRRTEKIDAAFRAAAPGPRAERLRRLRARSSGLDAKRANLTKSLSAILFSTKKKPKVGFSDETRWSGDVDIHDARVLPMKTGRAMLRKAQHKIEDPRYVHYKDDEQK